MVVTIEDTRLEGGREWERVEDGEMGEMRCGIEGGRWDFLVSVCVNRLCKTQKKQNTRLVKVSPH